LPEPTRLGPLAILALQNTSTAALHEARISPLAHYTTCAALAQVAHGQLRELLRSPWDLAAAKRVATEMSGQRMSAYLRLLWDGTDFTDRAEPIGVALGSATQVVADIAKSDSRVFFLPPCDQYQLVQWARQAAVHAQESGLPSVARRVPELLQILAETAAATQP
jgi:hypothetical protein